MLKFEHKNGIVKVSSAENKKIAYKNEIHGRYFVSEEKFGSESDYKEVER